MAKLNLGIKRKCISCGALFYDLHRHPARCPKCQTHQPELTRPHQPPQAALAKEASPIDIEVEDVDIIPDDEVVDDLDDDDVLGTDIEIEPENDENEQ